jgi:hypothetical protein
LLAHHALALREATPICGQLKTFHRSIAKPPSTASSAISANLGEYSSDRLIKFDKQSKIAVVEAPHVRSNKCSALPGVVKFVLGS